MDSDRTQIDPQNRYPAGGLRRCERLALQVLAHLPGAQVERTRDAIQIDHDGDEGIVVIVTAEAIEVRLPAVEWTMGAFAPACASKLWRRIKARDIDDGKIDLREALRKAQEKRRRQFRKCKYCGQMVPPEHRHGKDVCHGCAERHDGIVH